MGVVRTTSALLGDSRVYGVLRELEALLRMIECAALGDNVALEGSTGDKGGRPSLSARVVGLYGCCGGCCYNDEDTEVFMST